MSVDSIINSLAELFLYTDTHANISLNTSGEVNDSDNKLHKSQLMHTDPPNTLPHAHCVIHKGGRSV